MNSTLNQKRNRKYFISILLLLLLLCLQKCSYSPDYLLTPTKRIYNISSLVYYKNYIIFFSIPPFLLHKTSILHEEGGPSLRYSLSSKIFPSVLNSSVGGVSTSLKWSPFHPLFFLGQLGERISQHTGSFIQNDGAPVQYRPSLINQSKQSPHASATESFPVAQNLAGNLKNTRDFSNVIPSSSGGFPILKSENENTSPTRTSLPQQSSPTPRNNTLGAPFPTIRGAIPQGNTQTPNPVVAIGSLQKASPFANPAPQQQTVTTAAPQALYLQLDEIRTPQQATYLPNLTGRILTNGINMDAFKRLLTLEEIHLSNLTLSALVAEKVENEERSPTRLKSVMRNVENPHLLTFEERLPNPIPHLSTKVSFAPQALNIQKDDLPAPQQAVKSSNPPINLLQNEARTDAFKSLLTLEENLPEPPPQFYTTTHFAPQVLYVQLDEVQASQQATSVSDSSENLLKNTLKTDALKSLLNLEETLPVPAPHAAVLYNIVPQVPRQSTYLSESLLTNSVKTVANALAEVLIVREADQMNNVLPPSSRLKLSKSNLKLLEVAIENVWDTMINNAFTFLHSSNSTLKNTDLNQPMDQRRAHNIYKTVHTRSSGVKNKRLHMPLRSAFSHSSLDELAPFSLVGAY